MGKVGTEATLLKIYDKVNNIEGSFKEIEMFFLMADSLGRYLKNG